MRMFVFDLGFIPPRCLSDPDLDGLRRDGWRRAGSSGPHVLELRKGESTLTVDVRGFGILRPAANRDPRDVERLLPASRSTSRRPRPLGREDMLRRVLVEAGAGRLRPAHGNAPRAIVALLKEETECLALAMGGGRAVWRAHDAVVLQRARVEWAAVSPLTRGTDGGVREGILRTLDAADAMADAVMLAGDRTARAVMHLCGFLGLAATLVAAAPTLGFPWGSSPWSGIAVTSVLFALILSMPRR